MTDKPYAHLTEDDVEKIWDRICRIRATTKPHKCTDTQGKIAVDFGVSKKTINRIASGETWSDVTDRIENEKRAIDPASIPIVPSVPESVINALGSLSGVLNHIQVEKGKYCLDHHKPLHWGWFEAWNGLHAVASDTVICWKSRELNDLARWINGLENSEIGEDLKTLRPEDHRLSISGKELPTFYLAQTFERPLGDTYRIHEPQDGLVKLVSGKITTYIGVRYAQFAEKNDYEIAVAGESGDIVYFTKKAANSKEPTVHAMLATVKPNA